MINSNSIETLVILANEKRKKISEIVLEQQSEKQDASKEDIYNRMKRMLDIMKQSEVEGCKKDTRSTSGLTGGDAYKMLLFANSKKSLFDITIGHAITRAIAVAELNAAMGKVVAAPTAGSCGILPACVITMMEDKNVSKQDAVMALFCASGIGMVIADKASVAGASGGCQAECGTASAMAAAAITEMSGGTPQMCSDAAAIALKNVLGLVCDPVAGLVEIPCIKRNASGAMNAFLAAQMALAGINSKIPADEVIIAMKQIGDIMPSCLKETAMGGLAITPSAKRMEKEVYGHMIN